MKRIFIGIAVLLLVCMTGFGIYVSDYYRAEDTVTQILQESYTEAYDHYIHLDVEDSSVSIIFYPGAKVESTAYLPLLNQFYESGMDVFLVEMPYHLAFFGSNRADEVIGDHPEITTWYMMGHSLGGAFAGSYAGEHIEDIDGLILLGAYLYGDYPSEQSMIIYGSEDLVLNRERINDDDTVYVIEGGNHAYFGDYGEQEGDGQASITRLDQQTQTVQIVLDWMK